MTSLLSNLFNLFICGSRHSKAASKTVQNVSIGFNPKDAPQLANVSGNKLYQIRMEEKQKKDDEKFIENISQNPTTIQEFHSRSPSFEGELWRIMGRDGVSSPCGSFQSRI